jgi:hypothetical protein
MVLACFRVDIRTQPIRLRHGIHFFAALSADEPDPSAHAQKASHQALFCCQSLILIIALRSLMQCDQYAAAKMRSGFLVSLFRS